MHIAMLAPLKRPITPDTTVSRNRVIVDLSLGLMKKGHTVTLVGTADSYLPGAQVIGVAPKGLNFLPPVENEFYQHTSYLTLQIAEIIKKQEEFDLIHNHIYPEYLLLPYLPLLKTPVITTVHSQMISLTISVFQNFPEAHLVAISHMAKKAAGMHSMYVVHNSVDTEVFKPNDTRKDYLLAVGRMSKAKDEKGNFLDPKGIQHAISVAQMTGERLKIAGNVEDPKFFETLVKPHLNDTIEFVGEVTVEQTLTRAQIVELFQGAKAFINAINWEEPFGLVMAESLACGTPVIAYNRGAVGEIVEDGKVGFIVEPAQPAPNTTYKAYTSSTSYKIKKKGIEGLIEAVKRISEIDRTACRTHAVTHFSTPRMVDEYEQAYKKLVR